MRKLLISTNAVAYGAKSGGGTVAGSWEVLADGALCAFESDGTYIDSLAPAITTDALYFAVGRAAGYGHVQSPLVYREGFSYEKTVYVAPVAKVMFIGYDGVNAAYDTNLPTLVAGLEASVRVVDLSKPEWDTSREYVANYVVKTGDTDTDVINGIVAALNQTRSNKVCTALSTIAGADYGFSLTSDTAGHNFTAFGEGILNQADILEYKMVNRVYNAAYVTATANAEGHGTSAALTEVETDFSTEDGNANSLWMKEYLWSVPSEVVSGATYTIYALRHEHPKDGESLSRTLAPKQTLIIAIPSGDAAAIAALDAVLAVI